MAQQVKVQITIAGETVSPFSGLSISQDVHQHHTFEVALLADAFNDTGKAILEQSKKYIGQECHIRFAPDMFRKEKPENEFVGLVTEVRLSRLSNGERSVVLFGYSPTILMDGNPQSRSFMDMDLSGMAEATLEKIPHSLSTNIQPNFTDSIPYTVQYVESNYKFLQRMAARYGEWCFYDGTQLIFGALPRDKKVDLPLVKDLYNLEFSFKLLPANFTTFAYHYLEHKTFKSQASAATVADLDEYGKFALEESDKLFSQEPSYATAYPIAQQPELDGLVEQQRTATANNMVMMTGTSDNPFLNVGSIINITGESTNEQDYGEFIIISLSHSIGSTHSYQNSFTAVPAELQVPPPARVQQPLCEVQSAEVMDNNDPEALGRIQVKFPWQEGTTPWIRVSQAYGGQSGEGGYHGFYFIPEIGSEVLVGFEHNNPDKPFVMSSIYHGDSSLGSWPDSSNFKKVIKTRSGNQIHLIDEDGKEKIRIFHTNEDSSKNEICLEMEGQGKITIKTLGELDISANSINIEAENNINITAGRDHALSVGSNMTTDVGADLKQNANSIATVANTSLDLTAGSNATLEGGANVSITGGSGLSVESGANTSVKAGANLSLEGGVVAALKGPVVKIN